MTHTRTAEPLPAADRRAVDSFVTDWLADAAVPGAAIAVVDREGVRYATGFGARSLSLNAPATPRTLFGVGSCTKSVTALAVSQLVERGVLAFDDPVAEHVDYYGDVEGDPVTVGDLLAHTSGLPSDGMAVALISRLTGGEEPSVPLAGREDFRRHVSGATAAGERVTDRETFFYYNSGYAVLGELVAAVDGRPFRRYVREEVLDPLGMTRTTFSAADVAAEEDAMTPYRREEGELTPASFPFDRAIDAAGGLLAPVEEFATYLRLQLGGGAVDGTRLLGADLAAAQHEPRATRTEWLDGREQEYGYGWMIDDYLDDRLVGHGGTVGVSSAWLGFLEAAGLGVVVACNAVGSPHPMHVGPAVLALLRGADPERVEPAFALRTMLDPLEGDYESYRGILEATVERRGGTLSLTLSTGLDERTLALAPSSPDPTDLTFHTVSAAGERVPVRFERTDDGTDLFVERWRLHRR